MIKINMYKSLVFASLILILTTLLFNGCSSTNDGMTNLERIRATMAQYGRYGIKSMYKDIYISLKHKQYNTAIKQLEAKRASYPKEAHIYFLLGIANYLNKNYSEAINYFSHAISIDKTRVDAYYYRSYCYFYMKQFEFALDDINSAILDSSTVTKIHNLNKALGSTVTESTLSSYILAHRANVYAYLKKYYLALDDINQAINTTQPPSFLLYAIRGNIYAMQMQYKNAYEDYIKSASLAPDTDEYNKAMQKAEIASQLDSASKKDATPTLKITNLSFEPSPVAVNKPFSIKVDFNTNIPNREGNIDVKFYFTISLAGEVLFTSKTSTINANNGSGTSFKAKMDAVSQGDVYTLEVFVEYEKITSKKSVKLIIK